MHLLTIRTQDDAVKMICQNDNQMEKLISFIGDIEIPLRTDYLSSIVRSIIGQHISVQAASAIYRRLKILLDDEITAKSILSQSQTALRETGLNERKTNYIVDLANKVRTNQLDLENISDYHNNDVMSQLMSVKGIGKWTAEMFLILSLGRPDVLAVDDVGIQNAAKWLYQVEKAERKNILIAKAHLWKPHRSIVSFYLWEAIHLGLIIDYNSVDELAKK